MDIELATRARRLAPSATIAAAQKARELKARGVHVYDFSLGEPDFDTPEHIRAAAEEAIRTGKTHYTPSSGIPELREAVARRYALRGAYYSPGEIVISNGAKHALHNVLSVLCEPGDEVLILSPYWVSYVPLVRLTGAEPTLIQCSERNGFKAKPEQLDAAITRSTRAVILNSPSNPTGAVYSPDELRALGEVLADTNVLIISDEIYEDLVYDANYAPPLASLSEDLLARTITISGVSKSYAMTGWRIGWSAAPWPVSQAIEKLQSQQTSNPCSISQYAALAAVTGDQSCVAQMKAEFARRRDLVAQKLACIPKVRAIRPDGAFYFLIAIEEYFATTLAGRSITDSVSFCEACLEGAHVALVPGEPFGAEGFVRLSFAAPMEELEAGLDALARFLSE